MWTGKWRQGRYTGVEQWNLSCIWLNPDQTSEKHDSQEDVMLSTYLPEILSLVQCIYVNQYYIPGVIQISRVLHSGVLRLSLLGLFGSIAFKVRARVCDSDNEC